MTRISRFGTFCTLCASAFLPTHAQELQNLYHLSKNSFSSHVEYHELKIPKGTETTIAELKGPGKVTYWYITDKSDGKCMYRWYLANPVRFGKSLKVQIQDQRWENGQIPSRDDFISVAFWYQAEPHLAITLQPFPERTAPSRAAQYNK